MNKWIKTNWRLLLSIGVGCVLLVLIVTFYVPKNTIVLSDDGFNPRTITIHAGETITFKSKRGKYFWPASDFHPSHALYPKFDPKTPIASADSWSFTFTEPGVYPFHDHLSAFYFGIIRVADANGNVPDDCMTRGGQFTCWQNQIFIVLAEKGVTAAYDVIDTLYKSEPTFAATCHYITHNIGLASYQFYRKDPNFIYSPKAMGCAAGFYHGFMEGFLGASGSPKKAGIVCDQIGNKIGTESPDARLQCYHGIGHGSIETAIALSGVTNRVDDMVTDAITMCEEASEGKDERYRCVSGAYNGIINYYIAGEYGLSLSTSDPRAFCARQKDVYKEACYGELNALAKWQFKDDFKKAVSYILSIPDEAHKASSVRYVAGMYALDFVSSPTFGSIISVCHSLPGRFKDDCLVGFTSGLFEHGLPGKEYTQNLAFCADTGLTATESDSCYKVVLGRLPTWYSKEKSTNICASLPANLQTYCAM